MNAELFPPAIAINPFPGLRPFSQEEDYLFFGRERQVDELLKKLRTNRFLSVVGVSGCGKSSLVKSGLLPSLHRGYLVGTGENWKVSLFRPGNTPIENLTEALATPGHIYNDNSIAEIIPSIVASTLRRSNKGLIKAVAQSDLATNENLLIVVDQFEEIFRYDAPGKIEGMSFRDEAAAFINLLLTASRQTQVPIYIVITMRSDFIGECTTFRNLPQVINDGQYLIPRMTRGEIKQAIKGPIAVSGATITDRLVSRLLNDVGDDPDQLPLLQHALMRTWEHWKVNHVDNQAIDLANYEAIGEMETALSKHADEAFAGLSETQQKTYCENLFKALTDKASDARGTRRPTSFKQICEILDASPSEIIKVIDQFRQPGRCFLMPPLNVPIEENTIIDISHESIMRIWEKLVMWVEEESQSAEIYLRLAESAALYERGNTGLWRDPDLQIALKWKEKTKPNAAWANRYDPAFYRALEFLRYSKQKDDFIIAQQQKQQRLRRRLIRIVMIVICAALVIVTLFGLKLWFSNNKLEMSNRALEASEKELKAQTKRAQVAKEEAIREKLFAVQQKKLAVKKEKYAEQQESVAKNAMLIAETEERKAKDAQQATLVANLQIGKEKEFAEKQKRKAEYSDSISNNLYLAALSQDLALQAVKAYEPNNNLNRLTKLLAINAYYLNDIYGNNDLQPNVFKALSLAAAADQEIEEDSAAIRVLKFHPTNSFLACGYESGLVRLWQKDNLSKPLAAFSHFQRKHNNIRAIDFHPTKPILAVGYIHGEIILWNWQSNSKIKLGIAHQGPVKALVFKPNGHHLISAGEDGYIKQWGTEGIDNGFKLLVNVQQKVTDMDLGQNFLVVATARNTIKLFRYTNQIATIEEYQVSSPVKTLSLSDDESIIALGANNGRIMLCHLNRKNSYPVEIGKHDGSITALEFSKDSNILATSGLDGKVKLWPVKNPIFEPVVIENKSRNRWLWTLSISNDDNELVFGGSDKILRKIIIKPAKLLEKICHKKLLKFSKDEWNSYTKKNNLKQFACE